jgi:hypothetical protein
MVINIYMPINPVEKAKCWRSILGLKDTKFFEDCIIVSDFNVLRTNAKKRGGIFCRDPFHDKMEELVEEWGMMDAIPH